jgi:hypothetical protein
MGDAEVADDSAKLIEVSDFSKEFKFTFLLAHHLVKRRASLPSSWRLCKRNLDGKNGTDQHPRQCLQL